MQISAQQTPITLFLERDALPSYYLMHIRTTKCEGCGTTHSHTQTYAVCHFRPRMGMGTFGQHMIPVTEFLYNIPLHWTYIPDTPTPACHLCPEPYSLLSHLPNLPQGERKVVAISSGNTAAPAKAKTSTTDLLDGI